MRAKPEFNEKYRHNITNPRSSDSRTWSSILNIEQLHLFLILNRLSRVFLNGPENKPGLKNVSPGMEQACLSIQYRTPSSGRIQCLPSIHSCGINILLFIFSTRLSTFSAHADCKQKSHDFDMGQCTYQPLHM